MKSLTQHTRHLLDSKTYTMVFLILQGDYWESWKSSIFGALPSSYLDFFGLVKVWIFWNVYFPVVAYDENFKIYPYVKIQM